MRKESIFFQHKITKSESVEMKNKLADLIMEKHNLDDDKLAVLNHFNNKIEVLIQEINLTSKNIRNGYIECREDCELRVNFENSTMDYFSKNEKKIVFNRKLTADERQLKID